MKKAILLLVALACSLPASGIGRFGVVAGVGNSHLFDYPSGYYRRTGFQGGAFVDWGESVLRTELSYQQRGVYELTDVINEQGYLIRTDRTDGWADYLCLPILARANLPVGLATLYLLGGPRLDVFLNWTDETSLQDYFDERYFARAVLGADIGAGIAIPIGHVSLMPEVRYGTVLTNASRSARYVFVPTSLQLLLAVGL